jgi:choline transporter-like protein 2/4/5
MSHIPPVYLKNGPNRNRKCTNVCCCLLFLLSIGALGYFYFVVYTKQHIEKLYTPVDSEGRECGVGDLNKFPLIYFVTPEEVG